jgi:hypothetical protein
MALASPLPYAAGSPSSYGSSLRRKRRLWPSVFAPVLPADEASLLLSLPQANRQANWWLPSLEEPALSVS